MWFIKVWLLCLEFFHGNEMIKGEADWDGWIPYRWTGEKLDLPSLSPIPTDKLMRG